MSLSQHPARKPMTTCSKCLYLDEIKNFLKEESLPEPYQDVQHGILHCPNCGDVQHCYYLSPLLQKARQTANAEIRLLANRTDRQSVRQVIKIKENYKILFDREQEKYRQIMEKVVAQDGTGN